MSEKDLGEGVMSVVGVGGKGAGWEGSDKSVSGAVREEEDEAEAEGGGGGVG